MDNDLDAVEEHVCGFSRLMMLEVGPVPEVLLDTDDYHQARLSNEMNFRKSPYLLFDELLGSYEYDCNKIKLYTKAIDAFSHRRKLDRDVVEKVVLFHGIAHSVLHHAKDNNGDYWFLVEDMKTEILELFAQLYTFWQLSLDGELDDIITFEDITSSCPIEYREYEKHTLKSREEMHRKLIYYRRRSAEIVNYLAASASSLEILDIIRGGSVRRSLGTITRTDRYVFLKSLISCLFESAHNRREFFLEVLQRDPDDPRMGVLYSLVTATHRSDDGMICSLFNEFGSIEKLSGILDDHFQEQQSGIECRDRYSRVLQEYLDLLKVKHAEKLGLLELPLPEGSEENNEEEIF